jgi:hypothetical protein
MKLSNKSILAYYNRHKGTEKGDIAHLLFSGNPDHLEGIPLALLNLVKKEIEDLAKEGY